MKQDTIIVLDLGSEQNTRIARAIRGLGVYSEIYAHDISAEELRCRGNIKGIIVNGGPNKCVDGCPIDISADLPGAGLPILTVCHSGITSQDLQCFSADDHSLAKELESFVFGVCAAEKNWNMKNFIDDQVDMIRREVGSGKVLLALSGGVDSSVVAALLLRAIGERLECVHVDHGLMRKGESEEVVEIFGHKLKANLTYVNAAERFFEKLQDVGDPEEKRKIIGAEFVRVFEEEAQKLSGIEFLAQGTIYPDIVESGTKTAQAVKSHHNVGGLPEDMKLKLVEPVKQLFKDEVRACGLELGLSHSLVFRQPFPGPGLGVRCLGAITKERLHALRESDAILRDEFATSGYDDKVWQYFTVIPEFKSVGVRDHKRTFDYPVIIRAVNTVDAMTAEIEKLPWSLLESITNRILAEVPGVNRVLYDMSPKPPATIEWE